MMILKKFCIIYLGQVSHRVQKKKSCFLKTGIKMQEIILCFNHREQKGTGKGSVSMLL